MPLCIGCGHPVTEHHVIGCLEGLCACPSTPLELARLENAELLCALRAIIHASDQCRGHRQCGHSMEPWAAARALLARIDAHA